MADEKESEQPKVTGWVTICRSGRSLDGRTISARMLHDAADVYKPEEFTAMMWPYHVSSPVYRWNSTNFGKVLALRAEDRQDATYLLAKLQPNKFAITANRDRQKIFTSAEFEKNYMGTGKSYLNGLALTDVPASPWTTELMFSQQEHDSIYGQPEVFSLGAEDNTEENPMNNQQYETLLNAVYNKGQQINALEARVNHFSQMLNQTGTQQQPAAAQPAPTQQPQPAYVPPQQFAVQPQPAYAPPQQFAVQPQPAYAQPQQLAVQPQPAYAQPQQLAIQPQPAYVPPQRFAIQPQPAYVPPQQFAIQPQPAYVPPQQFAVQPQLTDTLSTTQFQHLLTAMTGISAGVNDMEQKFAQLMQDTTKTPSLNPAGGNQINIV
ncbi:GPO family capsid scaffolding protein [Salmonella enterica]|nr:GPO family capsid scaffolding protein [Salmonella enterica]EJX0552353.1 GPO family capsid scaffolding protein [Salmonella enterica]EJX0600379.1 GPO family capsid scaffolding protein [Salmonella enterica]